MMVKTGKFSLPILTCFIYVYTSNICLASEKNVRFYLPGESKQFENLTPATTHSGESVSAQAKAVPSEISLDGEWRFYYDGIYEAQRRGIGYAQGIESTKFPADDLYETTMPVPGYWDDNIEKLKETSWWFWAQFNSNYRRIDYPMGNKYAPPFATLPYLVGTGFYRKQLDIPHEWQGKLIVVSVGGVVSRAKLYCNRSLVVEKKDYLTPFDADISGFIKPGCNELLIEVVNQNSFTAGYPISCAVEGYQGLGGGIYGGISLKVGEYPGIKDFYVYSVSEKLHWLVELEGNSDGALLQWSICDPNISREIQTGVVKTLKGATIEWDSNTVNMTKWSERNPKLYILEVKTVRNGLVGDKMVRKFGLRNIKIKGKNICLNGDSVYLRGVCESWYYPRTCAAPLEKAPYVEFIRKYKELGFNWLRFHTSTPREEFLEAADELGMMVQVESPRGSDEQTWVNILKTARKHPSVIIYCVSNEQLLDESAIKMIEKRYEITRKLVPDALFSPMEALRGVEYGAGKEDFGEDAITMPYLHNPRRLNELKKSADVFEPTGWGHFSFQSAEDANLCEINSRLAQFERPCLLHEVGIHGTYLDLGLERRYSETRIGTDLFASIRNNISRAGLADKVGQYYVHSCRWAQILRKDAIERARLCETVQGYDFLGAVDNHWLISGYTCGIMNEFFELKPGESAEDVLRYNNSSVLLCELGTSRNFEACSDFTTNIFASLYGEHEFSKGSLYWNIKDESGNILNSDTISVSNLPTGSVSLVSRVKCRLPDLRRAAMLKFSAKLYGSEYDITNSWSIWVFPKPDLSGISFAADERITSRLPILNKNKSNKDKKLLVVSELSGQTLGYLASGARVLLLGTCPFKTAPTSFQIAAAGRVIGNSATVISVHSIFSKFPNEGFCDWQFYRLLNDANAIVFEDGRIPFDPILEVVSSYKLIKKQAAVFELGVGKGSLLVCSLNIKDSDPGGMYLLEQLIKYAASNSFRPANRVELDDIN